MKRKLAVIMDPIESINIKKDSSFAMLLSAQSRGWSVSVMTQNDLYVRDGRAFASWRNITVEDNAECWFTTLGVTGGPLVEFDIILMRKDPPFDMEYIYTTYLLELAEKEGVSVINKPQSLRDANEKFFTSCFPQCTPKTLITRQHAQLKEFWKEQKDVIFKPLDGMGGKAVFRVKPNDPNISVILESLTQSETQFIMAQTYIPDINETGDKRILLINGQPIDYALARIPAEGETRGNLAAGAKGVVVPLTPRDRWICQQIAPSLKKMGLVFVGIDVIGDYLTEINVTSPTCIREIDRAQGLDIAGQLMDEIEQSL